MYSIPWDLSTGLQGAWELWYNRAEGDGTALKLTLIKTIYCKELLDTLRDKRTLGAMILLPVLLYPLLLIGGETLLVQHVQKAHQKRVRVALADYDSAALRTVLAADGNLQVVATQEARAALRRRELEVALVVPADCDQVLAQGGTVKVTLLYDGVREESRQARSRVLEDLRAFEEVIVGDRLAQRGLTAGFADPLQTEAQNVASAEQVGGFVGGLVLPLIITMMGLLGAFYPAIDLTAGEKEHGTLETLLTTPAGRLEIVLGKFLTVCTISWATVVLHVGSLALTVGWGLERMGGLGQLDLSLPLPVVLGAGLLMLPTIVLFSAGMMVVALFARSFKEAQNYLSPLYTMAMIPAGVAFLPGIKLSYGLALVPIAGPALGIKQLAMGSWNWGLGSVVGLSTCLYAGLALWVAVRLFAREDVVLAETDLLSWRAWRSALRRGYPGGPVAGEVVGLFVGILLLHAGLRPWLPEGDLATTLVWAPLFLLFAPALLFLGVRRYSLATLGLRRPGVGELLATVCAAVGGALLTVEANLLESRILPGGFRSQAGDLLSQVVRSGIAPALLIGAVVGGGCQETLFRGVILAGMLRSWRPAGAVILTALLFGLSPLTPFPLLTATCLGLLLGYLAWQSGSLWCSIVAHAGVNSLVLGLKFSPWSQPGALFRSHLPAALVMAGLLLCLGGVLCLRFLSPGASGPPASGVDGEADRMV